LNPKQQVPWAADASYSWINLKSFGNGWKDNVSDVLNAAIRHINLSVPAYGTLYVPPGNYTVKTNCTVPANVRLEVDYGAVFTISDGITFAIEGQDVKPEWFGMVSGGSVSSSQRALNTLGLRAAVDVVGAAGGGTVRLSNATYLVNGLITMDMPNVSLVGVGTASKIESNSPVGIVLAEASYVSLENLWLYPTGAGSYAFRSWNGTIFNTPSGDQSVRSRGPEHITLRDLKITGAAGINYGMVLTNTWFSTFENINMPGGDGTAILVESGGFNKFSHIIATNQYDDAGLSAWTGGIELTIQPDVSGVNSMQQCDDNLFESCSFDGIDGYCLYIHSAGAVDVDGGGSTLLGVGPARNAFVRCHFGENDNTVPCVLLDNAWRTTFIRCHTEHAGGIDYFWSVETTGQGNAWYNCSGPVRLYAPSAYQTIMGNSFYDHVGDITIASNVWATQLHNHHGDITDSGYYTSYTYADFDAAAGARLTANKIPYQTFSDRNATASGTSGTIAYFTNTPSNGIGSNGDIGFRDNPTAGAGIYQKRDGIWIGVAGYPNLVRGTFTKTGMTDNAATAIFTVTTTNESGGADGGAYICNVTALCTHIATSGAGNNAVIKYRGSFSRQVIGAGTGSNTAVEDTFTGTSAASSSGDRDISGVTMTVTETSEYVQTVNLAVNLTGTDVITAEATVLVEIIYSGFLTTPTLAAA
jgi:hypothetical protein